MELDTIGDEKTVLFLIMSDTDTTFNFILAMLQSQLINLLCDRADDKYGGRLPVHVRLIDVYKRQPLLRNRGAERRVYENRAYEAGKDHRYMV